MLEIINVRKVYNQGAKQVKAIDGVSLKVNKGEFISIMGPSGSGKSTLLHLIGGLDYPTSGEVLFEGKSLQRLNDNELTLYRRRKVGFIFQFFNLLPTLTAGENIALPLLLDGKSMRQSADRVNELLKLVGLEARRDHKPDELSGGEMQRVAIARALVTNPQLVLADEPTGNLDSKTGEEVLNLLKTSVEKFGHTTILVTHDAKAANYGKKIVQIADGRIIKITEINEIKS